jgi:hypothetical protein
VAAISDEELDREVERLLPQRRGFMWSPGTDRRSNGSGWGGAGGLGTSVGEEHGVREAEHGGREPAGPSGRGGGAVGGGRATGRRRAP